MSFVKVFCWKRILSLRAYRQYAYSLYGQEQDQSLEDHQTDVLLLQERIFSCRRKYASQWIQASQCASSLELQWLMISPPVLLHTIRCREFWVPVQNRVKHSIKGILFYGEFLAMVIDMTAWLNFQLWLVNVSMSEMER